MFVSEIVEVTNGILVSGDINNNIKSFSIDSRTIEKNDLFVSIVGEKFNGNDFIESSFLKGAMGVLYQGEIDNNMNLKYPDKIFIKVDDTISALQNMAKYKRSKYNIPVVAITGSVGKTSTKDLVASVMSQKYNVLKTEGNFNNHIGLPLTLLKLDNHDAMCVELGMNHFGEISLLSDILKPTVAVITNIGTAHIGNLGSRENILKAKLEILEGLDKNGCIIINNDNDLLHEWSKRESLYNIKTYAINNDSDFKPTNINNDLKASTYSININNDCYNVLINVPGEHFVYNSLCAIAVGNLLNVVPEDIIKGISTFELTKGRMEERKLNNNITLLVDCYNANYDSMVSSLEVLGKYKSRKIAVLGDMLELGEYSYSLHKKVGESVKNNNIDILITVGELSKYIVEGFNNNENVYICNNNEEATSLLKSVMNEDDVILIKASNSMKFNEIANNL